MNTRTIAAPAYAIALLMLTMPLGETVLVAVPLRLGQVAWRFGTIGLLSRALMTPLLGLLLAFAVALLLEHRRMILAICALSGLGVLLFSGMIGLFLLDAVQMRSQVALETRSAFDIATISSVVKHLSALVILMLITRGAWRARAGVPASARLRKRASGRATGATLVVGNAAPLPAEQ